MSAAFEIRCAKCERGSLLLVGQAGRCVQVDGGSVEIPRDFMIPTCDHCGAEQFDDERRAQLAVAVQKARVAAMRSAPTDKMSIIVRPVRR